MSPAELIEGLRERGVTVTTTRDGRVRTKPKRLVTDDERAFIRDNSALIKKALAALPLVEMLVANSPSIEDDLERLTREAAERNTKYALFRTPRGLLHLEELNDAEARRFAAAGKLTTQEVSTWHAWRQRRTRYPEETRYALFVLKAQRAGFHRLAVYYDGRVALS
jgi:hypothetical protein